MCLCNLLPETKALHLERRCSRGMRKARARESASMGAPYWGPEFSNDAVKSVLDNCKASYKWCDSEDEKLAETVRLIQAGKIVAWYQGAAEFGPRALGQSQPAGVSVVAVREGKSE